MLVIAAGISACLGILGLYLLWRGGIGDRRILLPGSWALIAAAPALAAATTSVERGLALGLVWVVLFGAGATFWESRRTGSAASERRRRDAGTTARVSEPTEGRLSRISARSAGTLLAAPIAAAAATLAWQQAGPGILADRIVISGFVCILAWSLGLILILSARHPWRATAVLAVPSLAFLIIYVTLLLPQGTPT